MSSVIPSKAAGALRVGDRNRKSMELEESQERAQRMTDTQEQKSYLCRVRGHCSAYNIISLFYLPSVFPPCACVHATDN